MTVALHNLAVYSLQIAVLVGAGALLLLVFRLENPRVRLAYWQTLLAACLLLPLLQPWKQDVMIRNMGGADVVELDAGHMAMVGRPEELAAVLEGLDRTP